MDNGLAKYGAGGRGCDGDCGEFHPKDMCHQALRSGKCERDACKYKHPRFTKLNHAVANQKPKTPPMTRKVDAVARRDDDEDEGAERQSDKKGNNQDDPFLALQGLVNMMLTRMTAMEREWQLIRISQAPAHIQSMAPGLFGSRA